MGVPIAFSMLQFNGISVPVVQRRGSPLLNDQASWQQQPSQLRASNGYHDLTNILTALIPLHPPFLSESEQRAIRNSLGTLRRSSNKSFEDERIIIYCFRAYVLPSGFAKSYCMPW